MKTMDEKLREKILKQVQKITQCQVRIFECQQCNKETDEILDIIHSSLSEERSRIEGIILNKKGDDDAYPIWNDTLEQIVDEIKKR